jgi:hypothetical protein
MNQLGNSNESGNNGFWDFLKYPVLILLVCYLVFYPNPLISEKDQKQIKDWITAYVKHHITESVEEKSTKLK